MSQFDFSGLWIPLVTPFNGDQLDLPALKRLVAHLARQGARGFVACGSTGEAASLSHAEHCSVLDAVLSAGEGKPVLMGLAGTQAAEMSQRLREFADAGASGVLVSAPYYLRPSQAGIVAHLRALADASTVPLVLYDVPARTGVPMELPTLLALAEHPNVQAITDAAGDADKTRSLIADGRLAVLAGNDDSLFSTLCMGGAGAIAASAHVLTQHFAEMMSLLKVGRLLHAQGVFHALSPITKALFAEPNPSVFKAVLSHQGWMRNELRAPHTCASCEGVQYALDAIAAAQIALSSQPPVTGGKNASSAPS